MMIKHHNKLLKILLIVSLVAILDYVSASTSLQKENPEKFTGQMKPFYRLDSLEQNCELHIEEYCFAKVCNGFIQLGLNENLDFSSISVEEE